MTEHEAECLQLMLTWARTIKEWMLAPYGLARGLITYLKMDRSLVCHFRWSDTEDNVKSYEFWKNPPEHRLEFRWHEWAELQDKRNQTFTKALTAHQIPYEIRSDLYTREGEHLGVVLIFQSETDKLAAKILM